MFYCVAFSTICTYVTCFFLPIFFVFCSKDYNCQIKMPYLEHRHLMFFHTSQSIFNHSSPLHPEFVICFLMITFCSSQFVRIIWLFDSTASTNSHVIVSSTANCKAKIAFFVIKPSISIWRQTQRQDHGVLPYIDGYFRAAQNLILFVKLSILWVYWCIYCDQLCIL